jgi:hypothetical protein
MALKVEGVGGSGKQDCRGGKDADHGEVPGKLASDMATR